MKGSTLIAFGLIDAAVTQIPVANFIALPLFDPRGNSIATGILPAQVSKVQFAANVSKNFILGIKNGANATDYEHTSISQQDALDVVLPGQVVGVKAFDANIVTGKFAVYFYA